MSIYTAAESLANILLVNWSQLLRQSDALFVVATIVYGEFAFVPNLACTDPKYFVKGDPTLKTFSFFS